VETTTACCRFALPVMAWLSAFLACLPALAQANIEQANDQTGRAVVAFQQGHREEAVALWQQALASYRAAGDSRRQMYTLENLGSAALEMK
jgi:tetratricopeptide (TPR) repeat protein